VGADLHDFARFAAAISHFFFRVEDMHIPAVQRTPSSRLGVCATNEVPDLLHRFGPVDLDISFAAPAFIGRLRFILRHFGRGAIAHQIHGFDHGFDTHGKKRIEIQAAQRVRILDLNFFL
jgi:hypothetical protein